MISIQTAEFHPKTLVLRAFLPSAYFLIGLEVSPCSGFCIQRLLNRLPRFSPLVRPRAAEDVFHRVVALVARVSKNWYSGWSFSGSDTVHGRVHVFESVTVAVYCSVVGPVRSNRSTTLNS